MPAPDPNTRLSGRPQTVDGVTFHPYRTGIAQSAWASEDGRIWVRRNHQHRDGGETYNATVDGASLKGANPNKAKRFRSMSAAMLAAVLHSKRVTP